MQSESTITVYGLFDPESPGEIVYVGATRSKLKERLDSHLRHKGPGRELIVAWVASLAALGRKPQITALETTTLANADAIEERLINSLKPRLNQRLYSRYSLSQRHATLTALERNSRSNHQPEYENENTTDRSTKQSRSH